MLINESDIILSGSGILKTFRRESGKVIRAIDGMSFTAHKGTLTALVGPDGSGKTTLIRLVTGLMKADAGDLKVLGIDVAADPQGVQDRVGYMPQKFGLYEDLTALENLDLYADLHGVSTGDRKARYARLLEMTAMTQFIDRRAGRMSGGMKQKLGLACTLVRAPELLILDEPTVGVDPLSRRELWEIIRQLVEHQRLTVLLSTSYLDEAEHCEHVIVMHHGKVLVDGAPKSVTALAEGRTFLAMPAPGQHARGLQTRLLNAPQVLDAVPEAGHVRYVTPAVDAPAVTADVLVGASVLPTAPRFEDGFMTLLREVSPRAATPTSLALGGSAKNGNRGDVAVKVHDLVRMFGAFTAVDHVSFEVNRGEIFGLLGPNGAGKTTTFRMLCGLLAATSGELFVAGVDVRRARDSARQKLGYVAQKFSLYGQLNSLENLDFFASAYGLRGEKKRQRIDWALKQLDLADLCRLPSGQLPGGYKQRLAMAAALLHEPEILFLDEPTSGADPIARREFWQRINALADQGVTVIVTTHFMEEAEYCDRIVIQDAGKMLAQGTPGDIRRRARPVNGREPTMDEAFVAIVEEFRGREKAGAA